MVVCIVAVKVGDAELVVTDPGGLYRHAPTRGMSCHHPIIPYG